MVTRDSSTRRYDDVARLDRVAFWNPLPQPPELSETAQRMIREADADIRAERLESALDGSFAVNALEPEYIPGFIRTAELLIATNRVHQARRLAGVIEALERCAERNEYALSLAKVMAHVDQASESTLRVAWTIIETRDTSLYTPYIPAAIDQLVDEGRLEDALDLANSWAEVAPADPTAVLYCVRENLRDENREHAADVVRAFSEHRNANHVWPEHLVARALVAIAAPDDQRDWSEVGTACQAIRDESAPYSSSVQLLEFLVPALRSPHPGLILAALLALNAGDLAEADTILQTIKPANSEEAYLIGVALSRTSLAKDDQTRQLRALGEAFSALGDPQAASLSRENRIFDPPAGFAEIGHSMIELNRAQELFGDALHVIDRLRKAGAESGDLDRLEAEIMGQSGSRREALIALEELLDQQEASRQYQAAIETLESMIRISPGNLALRSKLVDKHLRLGGFDKAIDQLVIQARLLHKAGRTRDAEPPVHRAIEIATMTGDWDKVAKLHRLLISFDPEDTRVRHAAVTTYVQYGRTREALDQLREIARISRAKNNLDEAIAASHQMLALAPNDPDSYHQLGELLVSIEEYGQADRVYRRLASLVPDDPSIDAKRSAIQAMARNRR